MLSDSTELPPPASQDSLGEVRLASRLVDAPATPVVAYPYTGDYRIDTLIDKPEYRWNKNAAMGTSVSVTYSFMTAKPVYGGTDEGTDRGFSPFTAQQVTAVYGIFARLESELGISFREVTDSASSFGEIRFGNNTQRDSVGYAYLPYSTRSNLDGDVWLDRSDASALTQLAPGTYAYATLVHEIGHALGLNHPGNYNAGTSADPLALGNYLGVAEDNANYTIMSYRAAAGGQERDWFGMYDLLTLKTLYGADNSYNSGNSTYAYGDSAGAVLSIIDDGGGTDTIDLSTSSVGAVVDLRPGTFSSVGLNGRSTAANNLSIDLFTVVENFIGTPANDQVTGNEAANVFMLGTGVNTADGGAGIDQVRYAQAKTAYHVSAGVAGALTVSGAGSSDALRNVERLVFTDRSLAFDLDASAGNTARIITAAFGRVLLADAHLVGVGIGLFDAGYTLAQVAVMAVATDYFQAIDGSGSHADIVNLLYTHVVGAAPSPEVAAPYIGMLDRGMTVAELTRFAADTTEAARMADLVGLASTGLSYT
ncbi:MAG: M10 family metallopeptidase C-terminal domain-containing protein [Burkholderiaceae bacterium]|nr:M10 family metallopeptidase C-terminal domain-containing protein [Burkholderiaceae bacterium]MDP1968238.1 M10 family metallopeptidase C-terminal domain-containing protein [Burkholderiaceae bacterium]